MRLAFLLIVVEATVTLAFMRPALLKKAAVVLLLVALSVALSVTDAVDRFVSP